MSQPPLYRKLPGRGTRREGTFIVTVAARQSALWLGVDHLLLVDSTLASQDLKRFFFRDIQAVIVRKTHSGRTVNIVMASFAAVVCGLTLTVNDPAGRIALFVIAAFFGVVLLVNSLFGPTCETHLQTAVQREQLPSLHRLRTARKVLRTLRPLIESAQGQLTAEEARARAATLAAAHIAPAPVKAAPELRPCRGSFHTVLFPLLLVDGLLNGAAIFLNSMPLALVQLAVLFGIILTLVGALIRQQDTDLPAGLRRLAHVIIGYVCVLLGVGFVINSVHAMQNPSMQNDLGAMKHFASLDPFEHPWLLVSFAVLCVCSSVLGITGSVLLARYNRARQPVVLIPPAPLPPAPPSAPQPLPVAAAELPPPLLVPPVVPPPPPAPPANG
ncbi:MAG: hypothetical protein HZA92_15920 [Verrucomicrobia bacterium]|nr:hypothetical protein [Verrucomicrobiota bacterium]